MCDAANNDNESQDDSDSDTNDSDANTNDLDAIEHTGREWHYKSIFVMWCLLILIVLVLWCAPKISQSVIIDRVLESNGVAEEVPEDSERVVIGVTARQLSYNLIRSFFTFFN